MLSSLFRFAILLAGPIPPELGALSKLRALYLSNNELTGALLNI